MRLSCAPWIRLVTGPLLALIVFQSIGGASSTLAKEFAVIGIVDCGVRSGRACPADTTVIGLRTDQISGRLQTYKVDLAWILKHAPNLHQDDQLCVELRDDARSDGILQALAFVEKCDGPVRRARAEDDVHESKADATPTRTPTIRVLTCNDSLPDPDAEATIGSEPVTTFTVEMGDDDGFAAYLIDPVSGDIRIQVFYEGVQRDFEEVSSPHFEVFFWGPGSSTTVTFVVTLLSPGSSGLIHVFCTAGE